jgi:hypothetical protein
MTILRLIAFVCFVSSGLGVRHFWRMLGRRQGDRAIMPLLGLAATTVMFLFFTIMLLFLIIA